MQQREASFFGAGEAIEEVIMRSQVATSNISAGIPYFGAFHCMNCGEALVSPVKSAYLGGGRVRHFWSCDACGQEFQTSIRIATLTGGSH